MSQTVNNRWLLPDGIDEVLPPDAESVELLRQKLLLLFDSWGYDLVMPAMIEFTDSLLTGTANSLDRKTFTLIDQLTGKQMGLRSDMTPQVARIDAHRLANAGTSRFCYCGQLVHAHTDGLNPSRSPLTYPPPSAISRRAAAREAHRPVCAKRIKAAMPSCKTDFSMVVVGREPRLSPSP